MVNENKIAEQQQKLQLQQNIQYLEKYHSDINSQIEDLNLIEKSIQEISEIKKDSEIFVPVVNGIFFKAKLTDASKFLVNIGAEGTVVEMSAEEAKKLILEQISKTKENKELISKDLNELIKKFQELQ
jgi:prefoldin alpha subunit